MTTCLVYRSEKKESTYLYLPVGEKFEDLPNDLRAGFGEATVVMKLDIGPDTRLAQADPGRVLRALDQQGYYLQLPPEVSVEELLNRAFG